MFHPYAGVTGRFEEDLEGHKGPTPLNIMCSEHYETDLSRGFVRGYSYQVTRSAAPVTTAIGGKIPWGKNHHDEFKNRFNKIKNKWRMHSKFRACIEMKFKI